MRTRWPERSGIPARWSTSSTNIWGELAEEEANGIDAKSWLMVDVATGTVTPHSVKHARRVIDLPPIYADGLGAPELDAAIADRRGFRLRAALHSRSCGWWCSTCPRTVARELNHAQIRAWKASALHFHLDLRRPVRNRTTGVGAPGRRQTLPEVVRDWLSDRALPGEIDRERFVARGVELVEQAETDGGGDAP